MSPIERPARIDSEADMTPENVENQYQYFQSRVRESVERIAELKSRIVDLENRIAVLEAES